MITSITMIIIGHHRSESIPTSHCHYTLNTIFLPKEDDSWQAGPEPERTVRRTMCTHAPLVAVH